MIISEETAKKLIPLIKRAAKVQKQMYDALGAIEAAADAELLTRFDETDFMYLATASDVIDWAVDNLDEEFEEDK